MKKIFRMALVCALAGATLLYTGCTKDYSDDINDLKDRVSSVESTVASLQAAINAGSVITNVQANSEGYLVTLSNGQSYQVYNGKQGEKGDKGDKGDTGATGATGAQGAQGEKGDKGDKGDTGAAGTVVTIGEDGYFYFDGKKTDYIARGEKGETGATGATGAKGDKGDTPKMTVGENGNWFADGVDTGVKAQGEKGDKGDAGYTPYIGENGNWWIKDATTGEPTDTGVKATTNQITLDEDGYICIDGKSTGVKAGNVAVWDEEAGTVTFLNIDGEGGELVIGVCELTSIVFVPQLYLEGIEAMEYDYVDGHYWKAYVDDKYPTTGEDDEESKYSIAKKTILGFGAYTYGDAGYTDKDLEAYGLTTKSAYPYHFNEVATAEYHVNPTSFDLSKATFTMEPTEKMNVTRADGLKWDVNVVDIERDGDVAKVSYTIENPEYVTVAGAYYWDKNNNEWAFDEATEFDDEYPIGLVRLNAQLNDSKKEVSSDYAAIAPFAEKFADLAFISKYAADDCGHPTEDALYETAEDAIEHAASVSVQYQTLDTDLAKIIKVHMNPAGTKLHQASEAEDSYTLAEIQAKYPGFEYKFQLIPYTLGDNKTPEASYGVIDGSTFVPGYPGKDGKTVKNSGAEKDGISSVGRKPLVLCTLVDETGNVVLYGFFKIVITEDETFRDAFIVKEFTTPYTCKAEAHSSWLDCSFTTLESELQISKNEFKDRYGDNFQTGHTYIFDGEDFVEDFYLGSYEFDVVESLGEFVYTADKNKTVASTNDKFGYKLNQYQMDFINKYFGGEVTLYGKFGSDYDYVFIGVTVKVADKPVVKFVEHLTKYWYTTADDSARDLIFVNPRIPRGDEEYDDVQKYNKWINSVWAYNTVTAELDASSKSVYSSVWSSTPYTYHYELAPTKEQPTILGYQLIVKEDGDVDKFYYADKAENCYDDVNLLGYLNTSDIQTVKNGKVVEDFEGKNLSGDDRTYGKITYVNTNDIAKAVLNQFPAPQFGATEDLAENLADMLYVNVNLVATYADCEIPLATEQFHVGFFRPVDIVSGDPEPLRDGITGGSKITLGDFFNATDWKDHDIFVLKTVKDVPATSTTAAVTHTEYALNEALPGLTWWEYYGFSKIHFRMDQVVTDMNGSLDYVYEYTYTAANGKEKTAAGVQKELKLKVVATDPKGYDADQVLWDVKTTYPKGQDVCFDWAKGETEISFKDAEGKSTKYIVDPEYVANYCKLVLYNNADPIQSCNLYIPVDVEYYWGTVTGNVVVPIKHTRTGSND